MKGSKKMEKEITIYASKKSYVNEKGENKNFYVYSTRMKKDGTDTYLNVKFKEECGNPSGSKCPMNIVIKKEDVNITEKERVYTNAEGEEKTIIDHTMWVSKWKEGSPFVDHSTDGYF